MVLGLTYFFKIILAISDFAFKIHKLFSQNG